MKISQWRSVVPDRLHRLSFQRLFHKGAEGLTGKRPPHLWSEPRRCEGGESHCPTASWHKERQHEVSRLLHSSSHVKTEATWGDFTQPTWNLEPLIWIDDDEWCWWPLGLNLASRRGPREQCKELCVPQHGTTSSLLTNDFLFECQLDSSGKNGFLGQGSSTWLNLRATLVVLGQVKGNQTLVEKKTFQKIEFVF